MRTIALLPGVKILPVLIAALFAVPLPSHASIIEGNFTGTVALAGTSPGSNDQSGVFGIVSAADPYAGAPVAGTFTYDTALAPPDLCDAATSGLNCSDASAGGPGFNPGFLSVSLTINAHTVTFSNANKEVEVFERSSLFSEFAVTFTNSNIVTEDFDGTKFDVRSFTHTFITDATTLVQNFSVGTSSGAFGTGIVSFDDHSSGRFASISFDIDSLTVGPSAIPEPGSMGLLCMVLAGLGVTGYRRSNVRQQAAPK